VLPNRTVWLLRGNPIFVSCISVDKWMYKSHCDICFFHLLFESTGWARIGFTESGVQFPRSGLSGSHAPTWGGNTPWYTDTLPYQCKSVFVLYEHLLWWHFDGASAFLVMYIARSWYYPSICRTVMILLRIHLEITELCSEPKKLHSEVMIS